jgi:hypothetical protein
MYIHKEGRVEGGAAVTAVHIPPKASGKAAYGCGGRKLGRFIIMRQLTNYNRLYIQRRLIDT